MSRPVGCSIYSQQTLTDKWMPVGVPDVSRERMIVQARQNDVEICFVEKDRACPDDGTVGLLLKKDERAFPFRNGPKERVLHARCSMASMQAILIIVEDRC